MGFGISDIDLYDYIYSYKRYDVEAEEIKKTLRSLGEGDRVAEIACGTGRYLEYFPNAKRFGVDICEKRTLLSASR